MTPDQLAQLDQQVLWHPFTQHQAWGSTEPVLVIDRAEQFHLIDANGNRYLDGVSSLWCNVHGHRVPELDNAVVEQLDRVAHSTLLGLSQTQAVLLAQQLLEAAPAGLARVFYSDSGATAVEAALKMAVQYQVQRGHPLKRGFLTLQEAYHGDTLGAVSLGFSPPLHRAFEHLRFDVIRVPPPHPYRDLRPPQDVFQQRTQQVCEAIAQHAYALAAVVVEPLMQGAAGMLAQPPGYLAAVRKACSQHGVLLICDEVATGLGRTGKMWACDHDGVTPDILCVAKGLSGGYLPVAATLATQDVFNAFVGPWEEGTQFFHGHTFSGNALGCAVSRVSLQLLQQRVMPGLPERVEAFAQALAPLREHAHVGDLRQRGLMVGVELVANRKGAVAYERRLRMGHRVCALARQHGVIIRPLGDVVILMPAPAMPTHLLVELAQVAGACIDAATREGP